MTATIICLLMLNIVVVVYNQIRAQMVADKVKKVDVPKKKE